MGALSPDWPSLPARIVPSETWIMLPVGLAEFAGEGRALRDLGHVAGAQRSGAAADVIDDAVVNDGGVVAGLAEFAGEDRAIGDLDHVAGRIGRVCRRGACPPRPGSCCGGAAQWSRR